VTSRSIQSSLNVTVVVPRTLRPLLEGRRELHFGAPASANLGDLLETLFRLYPQLGRKMISDTEPGRAGVHVAIGEQAALDLAHHGTGVKEGLRIYLVSPPSRQPAPPAGLEG
jgi:hypothetical protein